MSRTKTAIFATGLGSGFFAQVFSIVIGIASIPILLSYFGAVQFGAWMVISSLGSYLVLTQAGTSTATAVLISQSCSNSEKVFIYKKSRALLIKISSVFLLLSLLLYWHPEPLTYLFGKASSDVLNDASLALFFTVFFYFLKMPFNACTAAFIGMQRVELDRLYTSVLPVLFSFLALLLTIETRGNLTFLAVTTGVAVLLAAMLSFLHVAVLCRRVTSKTGTQNTFSFDYSVLFKSSYRFFIIGLASLVVWNTDNLVISRVLGVEYVAAYAVTFKIFTSVFSALALVGAALMPMIGHAAAKNEWAWIQKVYTSATLAMATLGGALWLGGVLFASAVIDIWTGPQGYAGPLTVFAFGGYGYVLASVNIHANILSSLNTTKKLAIAGVLEAVVNLVLSLILIQHLGVGGVAVATLLAAFTTVFWMLPKELARCTETKLALRWNSMATHFFLILLPLLILAVFLQQTLSGTVFLVAGILIFAVYCVASLAWLFPKIRLRQENSHAHAE